GPGREAHELVPVPSTSLTDLRGEYWDNITMAGPPRVTRDDPAIDFGWTLSSPDTALPFDWYSVRWSASLVAPASSPVRIGVEGNDGYRLYLDGVLLIDNWRKQSYRTMTKEVRLERGRSYDIKLEYYENTGGARVKLVWDYGVAKDG